MEQLEQLLRSNGNRLTAPRREVFKALEQAGQPLSLQQLSGAVEGVDRTSVYRALELFAHLDIIEIVHVGWKKRYELASPFRPHHHHLQCTKCHQLIALDTPELERLVTHLAKTHGYVLTTHHIELLGLCPHCQALS